MIIRPRLCWLYPRWYWHRFRFWWRNASYRIRNFWLDLRIARTTRKIERIIENIKAKENKQ